MKFTSNPNHLDRTIAAKNFQKTPAVLITNETAVFDLFIYFVTVAKNARDAGKNAERNDASG